jgi:hypothetical protein
MSNKAKSKRVPFNELPLLMPDIMANRVVTEPITFKVSRLFSGRLTVEELELRRLALTDKQVAEFENISVQSMRDAYESDSDDNYFKKAARSKSSRGRDTIYGVLYHWLESYLTDPAAFIRNRTGKPIPKVS